MQSRNNKLIKNVLAAIENNALLKEGDKVVVGLSGGADSMCLTHVLYRLRERLGIDVAAAHLNHNIRGDAAERDALAAQSFAGDLGIEFYLSSENVREYAKSNSKSEELAGRELRYRFFDRLCREYGYTHVATAHNKNDNAETILMNFIRGSGLAGLSGIPARRGNVIRPLIDVSRREIEEYCIDNALPYVTDATNLEAVYTRNKVRLDLIPQIQRGLNSNFINTVTANAGLIRDENDFLGIEAKKALDKVYDGNSADAAQISKLHTAIARRVIMSMVRDRMGTAEDLSLRAADDILSLCRKCVTGKRADIMKGYSARISYGRLIIEKETKAEDFFYTLRPEEEIYVKEAQLSVSVELCDKRENDGCIYLSCDDIDTIAVRSRREGDIFYPAGMSGKKKLKEFFIDKKIPSQQRGKIPIVDVGGDIAAVSDIRTDRRYAFGKNRVNIKIKLRR